MFCATSSYIITSAMIVSATVLLFGATLFSKVEAGCIPAKKRTDYDYSCTDLWNKALEQDASNDNIKEYVKQVNEKCPNMIDMKSTTDRQFFTSDYDTWTTEVITSLKSDPKKSVKYIVEEQKPICWDDNGQIAACDYWWKVATYGMARHDAREHCIGRILHHCRDMISQVDDKEVFNDRHYPKGYTVASYKTKTGHKATFIRPDPIKN